MNTHGVILPFGRHKGELLTRVPVSYLKWMVNQPEMAANWRSLAKAEFERRGDTLPKVEVSGHAIDNASLRVRKIWRRTALNKEEGLYSWLMRITLEAREKGELLEDGQISYLGMKLVIEPGAEFPVLKTIMKLSIPDRH
jgi:Putative quorum-sensing-regulated virulence factor